MESHGKSHLSYMVQWDMMTVGYVVTGGTYMGFPWTVPPALHGTVDRMDSGICGHRWEIHGL